MRCPFCGLEARRQDVCEHCGGPIPAAAEPGLASGAAAPTLGSPGMVARAHVPLSAQPSDLMQPIGAPAPLDQTQPVPPPGYAPMPPGAYGAPPQGAYAAPPPGYYAAPPPAPYGAPQAPGVYGPPPPNVYPGAPQAVVPGPIGPRTMGLHGSYALPAAAITPTMVAAGMSAYRVPAGEKWEKCLALTMPTLLVCALVVHYFPSTPVLWGMLFFGTFMMGLLIGSSAAVPSYDDCYADVGIIMIITVLLGPTIGLIAYVVTALVKQEFNTAMLALGIANILMRVVLFTATGTGVLGLLVAMIFSLFSMDSLTIATCFFGWILSSFFRPLED